MRGGERFERRLAAVLLLATGFTAYASTRSRLAPLLNERKEPLYGMLTARFAGQNGAVAPALYFLAYEPASRRLELVFMPPSRETLSRQQERGNPTLADAYEEARIAGGDVREATRAMGRAAWELLHPALRGPRRTPEEGARLSFWFDWPMPAEARPAFPSEMKSILLRRTKDPFYWLKAAAALRAAEAVEWTGLNLYDLWLTAAQLRRLGEDSIGLSSAPETELLDRSLDYVLTRKDKEAPPTVEVLNATEVSGLALRAAKILRLRGFDVLHFGNTRALQPAVRIVDRSGRAEAARELLSALGCEGIDVVTKMEARPSTDIQLVLGRDFARCAKL